MSSLIFRPSEDTKSSKLMFYENPQKLNIKQKSKQSALEKALRNERKVLDMLQKAFTPDELAAHNKQFSDSWDANFLKNLTEKAKNIVKERGRLNS